MPLSPSIHHNTPLSFQSSTIYLQTACLSGNMTKCFQTFFNFCFTAIPNQKRLAFCICQKFLIPIQFVCKIPKQCGSKALPLDNPVLSEHFILKFVGNRNENNIIFFFIYIFNFCLGTGIEHRTQALRKATLTAFV